MQKTGRQPRPLASMVVIMCSGEAHQYTLNSRGEVTSTLTPPQRRGAGVPRVQTQHDDDGSGVSAEKFFSIENLLNRRAPPPMLRDPGLVIGPRRPQQVADGHS